MIVRDEEAALSRCLNSVADVVDEIIIVDTGSTDRTVEIAVEHHATVLHHDFTQVDFAAARNRGLVAARGDTVLVLDADETLDPASAPIVRALAAESEDAGYVVTRRNVPADPARPAWYDHAVRLFSHRPSFRYEGRVHETIDGTILASGGRLRRSGIVLNHCLPDEPAADAKGRWYLELLHEEASDDPDRLVFLAAEYHKLRMYAEATAVAERVAALAPTDFEAQFNAALYHFCYGDDSETARAEVAAALRLRPAAPEALALLKAIDEA
jgi:glycosyltransferase involved in cell wall biosynthesis